MDRGWCVEGKAYIEEDQFDVEFDADDAAEIACLADVNCERCSVATIIKARSGDFLVWWTERDPRLPEYGEWYRSRSRDQDGPVVRSGPLVAEYLKLEEQMPPKHSIKLISRHEAYEAIARSYLPREFYPDALPVG